MHLYQLVLTMGSDYRLDVCSPDGKPVEHTITDTGFLIPKATRHGDPVPPLRLYLMRVQRLTARAAAAAANQR